MILRGQVIKGLGKAKIFVNMMEKTFYEKTNMQLYPGTLNIELENEYDLNVDYLIKPEEYGGDFNVQVQKCKILGNIAYIVRSEKNIKNNGDYNKNIIEIVSNINFREKYNLKNGDEINVQIK